MSKWKLYSRFFFWAFQLQVPQVIPPFYASSACKCAFESRLFFSRHLLRLISVRTTVACFLLSQSVQASLCCVDTIIQQTEQPTSRFPSNKWRRVMSFLVVEEYKYVWFPDTWNIACYRQTRPTSGPDRCVARSKWIEWLQLKPGDSTESIYQKYLYFVHLLLRVFLFDTM